jgi:hypothetical protein
MRPTRQATAKDVNEVAYFAAFRRPDRTTALTALSPVHESFRRQSAQAEDSFKSLGAKLLVLEQPSQDAGWFVPKT